MQFEEAVSLFKNNNIKELSESPDGLRFLKLRSLARKEHLLQLFQVASVEPSSAKANAMFRQAFETTGISAKVLDPFIREIYERQREQRRNLESKLISELYKIQVFDWGGLYQNSLERTIVDNYVKKITDYEVLSEKVENELHHSMRGYVLCSWYNHWTSIIIEDSFKDHEKVLPAVGLVKQIDFFISNVPFDLKVTHLPEGFITKKRSEDGLRPELTLLRQVTKRHGIHFDSNLTNSRLLQDLWSKLQDHPSPESQNLLASLSSYRVNLLKDCQKEPTELIVWLYENQGVRRFDASNRLFLVLVDPTNFFDSWKLKRAKPLLDQGINLYLDVNGSNPGRDVEFEWDGSKYTALSDVIFIVKPS